ncbi:hypothetical protein VNF293_43350 (plasmid) [Atlantibacter hermannii]
MKPPAHAARVELSTARETPNLPYQDMHPYPIKTCTKPYQDMHPYPIRACTKPYQDMHNTLSRHAQNPIKTCTIPPRQPAPRLASPHAKGFKGVKGSK